MSETLRCPHCHESLPEIACANCARLLNALKEARRVLDEIWFSDDHSEEHQLWRRDQRDAIAKADAAIAEAGPHFSFDAHPL